MILLLAACSTRGPIGSETTDSGSKAAGELDVPLPAPFWLTPTADRDGDVIVELSAPDGSVTRLRTAVAEAVAVDLPTGRYGVLAWVDVDGDDDWDGIWEDGGEPAARFGVALPREALTVPLRTGVPSPILDDNPEWVRLHDLAWALLASHVAAGTDANGFASHYLDEAFSAQIFQWDTCFMTLFGRYGADAFPVMASLDNFYGVQTDAGYIGRVVDEDDGEPASPVDSSEPMVNPPLFAWAEAEYLRQTGDASRLGRVIPTLDAYHDWIDTNLRTEPGLYYTSMLGSGMDNAPRDTAYDAWVDMSAQQALGRQQLAILDAAAGLDPSGDDAEHARICADLEALTWSDGWYRDLDADGAPLPDKTLAGIWPVLAGCAAPDRADAVADALADPAKFWRPHPFPSTSADSAYFDPSGYYWRGGVWAPTEFATVRALAATGHEELAWKAVNQHLTQLAAVADRFVPAAGELADDAPSDGVGTLWELYAPDDRAPGTRWDDSYLGRSEFVGWTGLGPTALLYEQVIGLDPDALEDTLTWTVRRLDRHGIQGYRFGDQLVDLVVAARGDADDPLQIDVSTSDAFGLVVNGTRLEIPAGDSTWTVDPTGPTSLVPGGPHAGSAIVGNGALVGVVGDDGGVDHLYVGDFGLDVGGGGTRIVADGVELLPDRVGLDPFFAAYAHATLPDGGAIDWRTFVGVDDALVAVGELRGGAAGSDVSVVPWIEPRDTPDLDGAVVLSNTSAGEGVAMLLSDGRRLELQSDPVPTVRGAGGSFDPTQAHAGLDGTIADGPLGLALDLHAEPGERVPFRWSFGASISRPDPLGDARTAYAAYQRCTTTDACRVEAANLYAAGASRLNGQVPADLTGQFTTNAFPQLYPRDAMMVARALLDVDPDASRSIVQDWLGRAGPSPGEWYARYDARGRGVDAGSGAAYDVPEWDSNGYLALLVEALGPETWSADEQAAVYAALDFLVAQQDADGLWTEGGIIEWTGRLPGTTMALWAGLDAGARLADAWGDSDRATSYRAAAGRARGGLLSLYDGDAERLGDERDGALGMDSSAMFGPVLGFPTGPLLARSAETYRAEESLLGGGIRYFDGNDYGQDLFYFTTAAVARDALLRGDTDAVAEAEEWMLASTNRFGLAPERVYASGDGAAPASPLSWCAAELAIFLRAVDTPVVVALDGEVDPAEYLGAGLVDLDGEPDLPGDPVAVYTRIDGDTLIVGVRTAGPPGDVVLWLSGADGTGPIVDPELRFVSDLEPGAIAEVDLMDCADCTVVWGDRGVEAGVPMAVRGLVDPQLIVQAGTLLPGNGALRTVEDGTVILRIEVEGATDVTLSGDRAELGAWEGDAVGLTDAGSDGDEVAGDGVWTASLRTARGGRIQWKLLTGSEGDGSWAGVEFEGDNRSTLVADPDGNGRVDIRARFGERGETILDP